MQIENIYIQLEYSKRENRYQVIAVGKKGEYELCHTQNIINLPLSLAEQYTGSKYPNSSNNRIINRNWLNNLEFEYNKRMI